VVRVDLPKVPATDDRVAGLTWEIWHSGVPSATTIIGTLPMRVQAPIRSLVANERCDVISTRRDAARLALALASAGAGAIHLALGPEHLREWAVLGTGFYVSGALQLLWSAALLRRERWLVTGALGSLLFVGVWLVSRTTGLPLGPERWEPEAVGRADVLCVALELAVAAGALLLVRRPLAGRAPARLARWAVALAAAAVVASTGAAVADPAHSHHGGPACAASATPTGVDANHDGADDGVQAWFRCQLLHEHDHHKGYSPS